MKTVMRSEFWKAVMTTTINVHPRIEGNYPYVSVFLTPAGREFGRINDGEQPEYFLTDLCSDAA